MSNEGESWCQLSEMRLFRKILEHKPVGINKHFHLSRLVDFLNCVYEDEETDFEDVLSEEDLRKFDSRREASEKEPPAVFQPKYKIRPTPEEINRKLIELYDMSKIEANEYFPKEFGDEYDFSLPEFEFGDLLRKKADDETKREQSFVAPATTVARAQTRRKRKDSGETHSSRSSTPASTRDLRKS